VKIILSIYYPRIDFWAKCVVWRMEERGEDVAVGAAAASSSFCMVIASEI
jgi:hypothetical protein